MAESCKHSYECFENYSFQIVRCAVSWVIPNPNWMRRVGRCCCCHPHQLDQWS